MTDPQFIRRVSVPQGQGVRIKSTTIRYIDGEYVAAPFDPSDPSEQVFRPDDAPVHDGPRVNDDRLYGAATAHAAAVLALVDTLRQARAAQWEAPPGTRMRPDTLLHDDPSRETAANGPRLRVRATVESGILALLEATRALEEAHTAAESALRPYVTHYLEEPAA